MKPTQEQVIAWAHQVGLISDAGCKTINDGFTETFVDGYLLEAAYAAAYEAGRKDENEATADEWWSCWQADMENGVKCLNERAAEQFAKAYPQINKFGDWLASQGESND